MISATTRQEGLLYYIELLGMEHSTHRSSSSSFLVEHAALGISTVSSLRANLPRIRGRLSASVLRHAYFGIDIKNQTMFRSLEHNQTNVLIKILIIPSWIHYLLIIWLNKRQSWQTLIVLLKFLWLRLALYFEILSCLSFGL